MRPGKPWVIAGVMFLLVAAFWVTGCMQRDATRDLSPEEVLTRSVAEAQNIKTATISGSLTAGDVELNYQGVSTYEGEESGKKLLSLTMHNQDGAVADVRVYITPELLYVETPDGKWTSSQVDPSLAEGWSSLVEQTRVADPASTMKKVQQVAESVSFVSDEVEDGRHYKVIRVEANTDRALELFGGILPPELPPSAYSDFHHTVWIDKQTLMPHRLSIHLQIVTSTGDLLPIHMQFEFRDINRAKLELPSELENLVSGNG